MVYSRIEALHQENAQYRVVLKERFPYDGKELVFLPRRLLRD